jgi:hypothetical protein
MDTELEVAERALTDLETDLAALTRFAVVAQDAATPLEASLAAGRPRRRDRVRENGDRGVGLLPTEVDGHRVAAGAKADGCEETAGDAGAEAAGSGAPGHASGALSREFVESLVVHCDRATSLSYLPHRAGSVVISSSDPYLVRQSANQQVGMIISTSAGSLVA